MARRRKYQHARRRRTHESNESIDENGGMARWQAAAAIGNNNGINGVAISDSIDTIKRKRKIMAYVKSGGIENRSMALSIA